MAKFYFYTGSGSIFDVEDKIENNTATQHDYEEYFAFIKSAGLNQEAIDEKLLGFKSINEFYEARNDSSDPQLQQKIELKVVPGILALGFYAKMKSSK